MNNDAARQEQLIKRKRKLLALSRNNSKCNERIPNHQIRSTVMDGENIGKVWNLADFRHHSAQYGMQKAPSDWRLHK